MYQDFRPPHASSACPEDVLVVEQGDTDVEEIIAEAQACGATNFLDGVETFWIVFADKPESVEAFTERALRGSFR